MCLAGIRKPVEPHVIGGTDDWQFPYSVVDYVP